MNVPRMPGILIWTIVVAASGQTYSASPKPAPAGAVSRPALVCPWLTQGSAAKALGGDVRLVLALPSGAHGTCTFIQQQMPHDQLRIIVGGTDVPACPADGTKVSGVGTAALRCRSGGAKGGAQEMITGAVRQTSFAVILLRKRVPSARETREPKTDTLEELSEQIAGSLF